MCSVIVLRSVGLLQNQASLPTRHVQQLQWSNGVPWLHQSSGYLHKARLSQAPIPYLLFKIILRITVIPYLQKPSHLFYVRYGQPSILASSGELTSNTETGSLTITSTENIVTDDTNGPILTGSPGNTITWPDSVVGFPGFDITRPGSGGSLKTLSGSLSTTTRISATPWVTVSSLPHISPPLSTPSPSPLAPSGSR